MKIKLIFDEKRVLAGLFDTDRARAIYEKLPIESKINTWRDEFYFSIPLEYPLDETATLNVKVGDIGYWPHGKAFAIFCGPTSASIDENLISASEVNIVGRLLKDPSRLKELKNSKKISSFS